jgi:hypothetical protein
MALLYPFPGNKKYSLKYGLKRLIKVGFIALAILGFKRVCFIAKAINPSWAINKGGEDKWGTLTFKGVCRYPPLKSRRTRF